MTADEIAIDLDRISVREFRSLFDEAQTTEEGDAILAKACGLTVEELLGLGQKQYRRLVKKFFAAAKEPLADPN